MCLDLFFCLKGLMFLRNNPESIVFDFFTFNKAILQLFFSSFVLSINLNHICPKQSQLGFQKVEQLFL